jgi:hypothetical protein
MVVNQNVNRETSNNNNKGTHHALFCVPINADRNRPALPRRKWTRWAALIGEMSQAGVLVQTEGCQPSSKGARVRINGGTFTVVDGPFAEAKELVGGMAVIKVQSKAEAIEGTKRFLAVAGRGESEIRQLHEMPGPD